MNSIGPMNFFRTTDTTDTTDTTIWKPGLKLPSYGVLEATTATATTTPENNDLIG